METYICKTCNVKFDANRTKTEWIDAAFGPCSKMVAKCPECGNECDEYCAPKQGSANSNQHVSHAPSCGSCCGGCSL
ncbi:MAG TPA: hypothetical protein ENN49_08630 [Bacteroidales bacterium]|nr:hypothetical protein [Bacteroidales bacterium]